MKTVRGRALLAVGLFVISLFVLFLFRNRKTNATHEPTPAALVASEILAPDKTPAETPAQTNRPPMPQSFTKRAADMTEDAKAKLAKDFKEKYKPAVEKWFKAYEGRIPFHEADFTLDKFHSCLGGYMYTFMIGDTTFTIQDSPKLGLKISYLMTRRGAQELNQMPGNGFVPNLNVPVTREEIIRMVRADSGVEFKPNEVLIKPTAAACALNGGAFVSVLPTGKDPDNALNNKISMVFGSDGKLINYTRDPFF